MKTDEPAATPAKIDSAADAAQWLRGKLTEAPYRGQPKGPIPYHGTTTYVQCAQCSIARGRPTAVPRRHARQHLRAHRAGLKTYVAPAPVEVKAEVTMQDVAKAARRIK